MATIHGKMVTYQKELPLKIHVRSRDKLKISYSIIKMSLVHKLSRVVTYHEELSSNYLHDFLIR